MLVVCEMVNLAATTTTTLGLFLTTLTCTHYQSICFTLPLSQPQHQFQHQQQRFIERRSVLFSSSSNDEMVKPYVGTAVILPSTTNGHSEMKIDETKEMETTVHIKSTDVGGDNKAWLECGDDDDGHGDSDDDATSKTTEGTMTSNIPFDLSSPREWLEYNEAIDRGACGAYTVLRCDLYPNNENNGSNGRGQFLLWGKEFHLERISNSFLQMITSKSTSESNQGGEKDSKEDYQMMIDQALLESEQILNALIQKATSTISCTNSNRFKVVEKSGEEIKESSSVQKVKETTTTCTRTSILQKDSKEDFKILMITLLWTPTYKYKYHKIHDDNEEEEGREILSIQVRGHSYCSNVPFNPDSYNPQPITASVALPITNSSNSSSSSPNDTPSSEPSNITPTCTFLPSRYDNLPSAKLSSWCRIRRPLEKLYKGQGGDVAEVLLARKMETEINENYSIETKSDRDWALLEGLTSNLFIVYRDGSIHTSCVENENGHGGVLGGYSRQLILEAAKRENIPIVFGPLSLQDGKDGLWVEAFVSSSIRLIVPVGRIMIPVRDGDVVVDDDDASPAKHDGGKQQPFHLKEFWSETPSSLLSWEERKWIRLYHSLNFH